MPKYNPTKPGNSAPHPIEPEPKKMNKKMILPILPMRNHSLKVVLKGMYVNPPYYKVKE